jgi:arylsulfatase A
MCGWVLETHLRDNLGSFIYRDELDKHMRLISLICGWLYIWSLNGAAETGAVKQPNIIVILADDLGYGELGCYGQTKIKTPHLDALAKSGLRWTQFYSGAPVCSPSRNALLTGRHTGGCNVQDLKRVNPKEALGEFGGDWPLNAAAYTLPMALKKVGYQTAAFGKWGMGEYGTTGAPDQKGFDEFYGYTDHRMCHSFYPPFLWRNGVKEVLNDPSIPGHAKQLEGPVIDANYTGKKHASKAILSEVLTYLDKQAERAKKDQPFFLYYCPLEPHVAMQPPAEWVEKYPQEWDEQPYRGEKSYTPHSRPRAGYAATISFLDHQVGEVMARLKQHRLDESTVVIFTSDNGTTHDVGGVDHAFFNSVTGLRGLKGSLYEGGIRVPTIMRWTGQFPAERVIDQPAYAADLMPTLCALTGADAGNSTGENLLPLLFGKVTALAKRRPLVWAGGGYGGQVAVRMGNLKAIRRNLLPNKPAGPTPWEVYDLTKDRHEITDIASTQSAFLEQVKTLLQQEYQPAEGYPALNIFAKERAEASDKKAEPTKGNQVFQRLDQNSNQVLTYAEWLLSPKAQSSSESQQRKTFEKLDVDQNQELSRAEFLNQWK